MKKVALFSLLLIVGIVFSQFLPGLIGDPQSEEHVRKAVEVLTMVGLGFIMIHVGYEFEIDKSNLGQYGWDYLIAMTAAAFPWIFCALYFIFVMLPGDLWGSGDAWRESLLAGRFAAPTSAGILFAMLAAAGLSATWVFQKARVLAIFDDLDTVLLMIPLKILMIGLAWQMGAILVIMLGLVWLAWQFLHRWRIPVGWGWVLGYSAAITGVCELIYVMSKQIEDKVPIHIEVLLPAFVLGCMMQRPQGSDPHADDRREGHQEGPEDPAEQRVSTIISAVFMVLVGLSLPALVGASEAASDASLAQTVSAGQPFPGWGIIVTHVLVLTVLINLGKMFPAFCYRREVRWQDRLALAIGLWPRGEVGAGVLILSIGYGIGGPMVTVAMLCLVLNLVLTGVFILIVKRLVT